MTETAKYYIQQESERLIYKKLTENEIPLWSEFFINNDRTRFVGSDRFIHLSNLEKATNWISRQMESYANNNFGQLAVIDKETGNFIGVSGLIVREIEGEKLYEVTYSFLPAYWNRGFATEVAIHFKNYAFQNIDCTSVISIIHIENEPSENVAIKNGMTKTIRTEFMEMPVHIFRAKK